MRTVLLLGVASATLVAAPVPKDIRPAFDERYGKAIPIDADCTVEAKRGDLRIAVESGSHRGFDDTGNLRAPHVTKEVTGDFTAVVTVESGDVPRHSPNKLEVYEAGAFVRSGSEVALLFAVQHLRSNIQTQTAGVYHFRKPGAAGSGSDTAGFGRASVHMKLERVGELLTASVETERGRWVELSAQKLPLMKSVQVGLYVSSSGKPFGATFAGYGVKAR